MFSTVQTFDRGNSICYETYRRATLIYKAGHAGQPNTEAAEQYNNVSKMYTARIDTGPRTRLWEAYVHVDLFFPAPWITRLWLVLLRSFPVLMFGRIGLVNSKVTFVNIFVGTDCS